MVAVTVVGYQLAQREPALLEEVHQLLCRAELIGIPAEPVDHVMPAAHAAALSILRPLREVSRRLSQAPMVPERAALDGCPDREGIEQFQRSRQLVIRDLPAQP